MRMINVDFTMIGSLDEERKKSNYFRRITCGSFGLPQKDGNANEGECGREGDVLGKGTSSVTVAVEDFLRFCGEI
jgi:hypothetical protein